MAPGRNRYHRQPLSGSRRGGGVLVHRVARVWPIDRGNGIDTLPANVDDVPGEGSINQHLDPATDLFAPLPHDQGRRCCARYCWWPITTHTTWDSSSPSAGCSVPGTTRLDPDRVLLRYCDGVP